ncbi:MAG: methyltransferase [Anaerolineae bacterium]|nr:methyltransferase [Anaerolineae bacterium]
MDFPRYLAAKKTVDDRALNKDVWWALREQLPPEPAILEVGAGIGTMVERLVEQGFIERGRYTAVDHHPANIAIARQRLAHLPPALHRELVTDDLFAFAKRVHGRDRWDVLIAHAVLDLLDIPTALPVLFSLLKPGGLFYFSLNFDGATILEPAIDPPFDALVEQLYHRTMDERMVGGRPSGDSRSGRHLFTHLKNHGAEILAAGGSDWVVWARHGRYPADEAYFLHFIINTMHQALQGHPEMDAAQFDQWIAHRHAQIERGELVYIAHQLDFLGQLQPLSYSQPGPDVSGRDTAQETKPMPNV